MLTRIFFLATLSILATCQNGGLLDSIGNLVRLPLDVATGAVDNSLNIADQAKARSTTTSHPTLQYDVRDEQMATCPVGWQGYGTSCYYFEKEYATNWTHARELCANRNARMWVPSTLDEFEYLRGQCLSTPYMTWLGGQGAIVNGALDITWSGDRERVADVGRLPWTLLHAPNYGLNPINTCLAYGHNQMMHVKVVGQTRPTANGIVWADCKTSLNRFAACERPMIGTGEFKKNFGRN